MDDQGILQRIEKRLRAVGLSADKASKLANKPDAIRNLRRAVKEERQQGVTTGTLNALAPVLGTTSVWLLAAAGPEEQGKPTDHTAVAENEGTDSAVAVKTRFVRASYGGAVAAGSFRDVDDWDFDPDERVYMEEVDKDYPEVALLTFTVEGDSMNDLKPHPLLAGQRVVCLDYEGLGSRVPLRDGMIVVVQQSKEGGHLIERSVKQLQMYRDRTEFCPRSTNPKHKPIVVPYEMEPDDGREVRILGLVRRVTLDMPGW